MRSYKILYLFYLTFLVSSCTIQCLILFICSYIRFYLDFFICMCFYRIYYLGTWSCAIMNLRFICKELEVLLKELES